MCSCQMTLGNPHYRASWWSKTAAQLRSKNADNNLKSAFVVLHAAHKIEPVVSQQHSCILQIFAGYVANRAAASRHSFFGIHWRGPRSMPGSTSADCIFVRFPFWCLPRRQKRFVQACEQPLSRFRHVCALVNPRRVVNCEGCQCN